MSFFQVCFCAAWLKHGKSPQTSEKLKTLMIFLCNCIKMLDLAETFQSLGRHCSCNQHIGKHNLLSLKSCSVEYGWQYWLQNSGYVKTFSIKAWRHPMGIGKVINNKDTFFISCHQRFVCPGSRSCWICLLSSHQWSQIHDHLSLPFLSQHSAPWSCYFYLTM